MKLARAQRISAGDRAILYVEMPALYAKFGTGAEGRLLAVERISQMSASVATG